MEGGTSGTFAALSWFTLPGAFVQFFIGYSPTSFS